jgi:hypothetical protein
VAGPVASRARAWRWGLVNWVALVEVLVKGGTLTPLLTACQKLFTMLVTRGQAMALSNAERQRRFVERLNDRPFQ